MIPSPLAPSYKLRTNIRPIRHAYLISSKSQRQLEEVMSYCCTQWGGISNLIIPVDPDLSIPPLHEHLLTLVDPEVVVSFLPATSERTRRRHEKLQARLAALWPDREMGLSTADFREYDMAAHPISVISDEDLSAREFVARRFLGARSDRLALLAMFGEVYAGQQDDYRSHLRLTQLDVGLDNLDLWAQQITAEAFFSPINLTGYGVHPYHVVGALGTEGYYELVIGDSVPGLCLFWNLRALREVTRFRGDNARRVLLLPTRLIQDRAALERLAQSVRSAPSSSMTSNLDLGLYSTSPEAVQAWTQAVRRSGWGLGGREYFTRRGSLVPAVVSDVEAYFGHGGEPVT